MDEPMIARAARATTEVETDSAALELMRAVARQDRTAFKTLYERYAPRLGSHLLKLLKRPELVDEAVNDVMLAVWQNAGRFDEHGVIQRHERLQGRVGAGANDGAFTAAGYIERLK